MSWWHIEEKTIYPDDFKKSVRLIVELENENNEPTKKDIKNETILKNVLEDNEKFELFHWCRVVVTVIVDDFEAQSSRGQCSFRTELDILESEILFDLIDDALFYLKDTIAENEGTDSNEYF